MKSPKHRPVLFVEPILLEGGIQRYRIWCKHCNDWHYHGPMEGHRECHCTNPDSPYHMTGYELQLRSAIDGVVGGRG